MKKGKDDELRVEYDRADLGKGARGKYLKAYRSGTNLILLKPEVARAFPTEQAVNEALSSLITVAQRTTRRAKRTIRRVKLPR
jgi:hypothetical protein